MPAATPARSLSARRLAGSAVRVVLGGLPFGVYRSWLAPNLTVACYHAVADDSPPHLKHVMPLRTPAAFHRDVEFFARRFHPIALADVRDHVLSGRPLPRHALLLTLDDGLREVAEGVLPICRRAGVPAALFLTTDALEQKALLYRHKASLLIEALAGMTAEQTAALAREGVSAAAILDVEYPRAAVLDGWAARLGVDFADYLKTRRPYLDAAQVRALIASGVAIGAHSIDHPRYSTITLDEQIRQTRESMARLERLLSVPCRSFAFPFLSDGVGPSFYERVFAEGIADVVFCIGEVARRSNRAIPRLWLESSPDTPVETLLRRAWLSAVRARAGGVNN